MKKLVFHTTDNWASTILRVILGTVILIHGVGKLSAEGYNAFIYFFTEYLSMPILLGWLTIAIETLGSMFLIIGLATRINATMLFFLFVGMIAFVHWEVGFQMNWWGQLDAGQEGYEYHILVLAMCATLFIQGGGRFSLDEMIMNNDK